VARPAPRKLFAVAAIGVAVAACALQLNSSIHAQINFFEHRNQRGLIDSIVPIARRIPDNDRFATTSSRAARYAQYALFPRRPEQVNFSGQSPQAVRSALRAMHVKYVLMTGPVTTPYLLHDAPWHHVVVSQSQPAVYLVSVSP